MKLGPGLSFSWKRALGVTQAKRRVSKKTGSIAAGCLSEAVRLTKLMNN